MVAYQGGVHSVSVGIIIILLCVSNITFIQRLGLGTEVHLWSQFGMYVSFIGLRLTKTSLSLIHRTRLRTKGQSAGYPQAQIGITSNSFQRRAP